VQRIHRQVALARWWWVLVLVIGIMLTAELPVCATSQTPSGRKAGPHVMVSVYTQSTPATPDRPEFGPITKSLMDAVARETLKNTSSAIQDEKGKVTLRLGIKEDGTIKNNEIKIDKSSGNDVMDQDAIGLVRRAAPFKQFPKSVSQSTLDVRVILDYNTDELPPGMLPDSPN
jgi:TonB family protein